MINEPVANSIRIVLKSDMELKSGDLVSIQVIKRLTGNKWAIGFRGHVYPAKSDIPLYPLQTLKVKVFKNGDQLHFKIPDDKTMAASGTPPTPESLSRMIMNALMQSEMAISPDFIKKIRAVLEKNEEKDIRLIRLLVNLMGKKIDLPPEKLSALADLLDYGRGEGDSSSGQKREQPSRDSVKKQLCGQTVDAGEVQDNLLQVFNHHKGDNGSWVVLPFRFGGEASLLTGTLRLLADPVDNSIRRGALEVYTGTGERWSFAVKPVKGTLFVTIFHGLGSDIPKDALLYLKERLAAFGVVLEEQVYSEACFDGFYPVMQGEGYNRVDTLI